ncbi:uncharacterized protein LOC143282314 [Babylonia areolata]|uniref:uncharacterized protein LOC143282314 n=1 Tax=Babylonia areolata TaxID=304850 RepID=UPI003FD241DC
MEEIQQALYGGNISGRRLRGVKINPIYQENDPGGRDGQSGDTMSESALPIGEIQIEVYESLPRNCHRSFLPSWHQPAEPSACDGKEGCSPPTAGSLRCSGEEGKEDCGERGGCSVGRTVEALRRCQGVRGVLGVDSLPWSFLQERSPARREPVWGAFRNLEDKSLPGLREDCEDSPELPARKRALESTPSLSSESRNILASFDDLGIHGENSSDVAVNVLESSGEGEPPGDYSASSGSHGGQDASSDKSHGNPNSEYQAYCVTLNNNPPNLASFLAHGLFPYGPLDAYSKSLTDKNGFSHSVHLAEHNHTYSKSHPVDGKELQSRLSEISHALSDKNGLSIHYPTKGGNGVKMNGMISPEDGHVLCTCPCHSQNHAQDVTTRITGAVLSGSSELLALKDSENTKSANETDAHETTSPGTDPSDSGNDSNGSGNTSLECNKDHESSPTEESGVHKPPVHKQHENQTAVHQHSETCMLDFENNNNCLVLYKVPDGDLNVEGFDTPFKAGFPSITSPTNYDDDDDAVADTQHCPENGEKTEDNESVTSNADADTLIVGSSEDDNGKETSSAGNEMPTTQTESNKVRNVEQSLEQSICKRCGCPKLTNSDANKHSNNNCSLTSAGIADEHAPKEVTSLLSRASQGGVNGLLSKDSILLRADELNTQACLQRYLAEAQRHYLQQIQQHSLHLPFDDAITVHTSPARSASPALLSTPRHTSHFIVPDTGELREDFSFNLDAVSYIEELGCCLPPKNSTAATKKSSKGPSSAASGTSSTHSSRQSSRNSKGAKHCSIEDLDAELEEEEEGQGVAGEKTGSLFAGIGGGGGGGGGSLTDSSAVVDKNGNLKKCGLSVINIGGTTSDPSFEMIVPYEVDFPEESYTNKRRQRREELEEHGWKEPTSVRERLIKTAVCVLLFCVFVGIFVGIAIHFAKETTDEGPGSGSSNVGMISGSVYGMR